MVVHQKVVKGLHGGDFGPVRGRTHIQLNGTGDGQQGVELEGNDNAVLCLLSGHCKGILLGDRNLDEPCAVVRAHEVHIDSAQVLNGLQKGLFGQLHRGSGGALEGNDCACIVGSCIA